MLWGKQKFAWPLHHSGERLRQLFPHPSYSVQSHFEVGILGHVSENLCNSQMSIEARSKTTHLQN